jgi:hypothetical protein
MRERNVQSRLLLLESAHLPYSPKVTGWSSTVSPCFASSGLGRGAKQEEIETLICEILAEIKNGSASAGWA